MLNPPISHPTQVLLPPKSLLPPQNCPSNQKPPKKGISHSQTAASSPFSHRCRSRPKSTLAPQTHFSSPSHKCKKLTPLCPRKARGSWWRAKKRRSISASEDGSSSNPREKNPTATASNRKAPHSRKRPLPARTQAWTKTPTIPNIDLSCTMKLKKKRKADRESPQKIEETLVPRELPRGSGCNATAENQNVSNYTATVSD